MRLPKSARFGSVFTFDRKDPPAELTGASPVLAGVAYCPIRGDHRRRWVPEGYRVAPENPRRSPEGQTWRADRKPDYGFPWEAITPDGYRTPREAAEVVVRHLESKGCVPRRPAED